MSSHYPRYNPSEFTMRIKLPLVLYRYLHFLHLCAMSSPKVPLEFQSNHKMDQDSQLWLYTVHRRQVEQLEIKWRLFHQITYILRPLRLMETFVYNRLL